jgi:hypothetical protein
MTLYIAHNSLVADTTTTFGGGTSYAAGIKVAIQLNIPDNQVIRIAEWGWSQDIATATSTLLALQTTDTASTVSTAGVHKLLIDRDARATTMSLSTTTSGYGNGALTSRTALRNIEKLYVPQVFVKQYPLGQWPIVGTGTAENFLHMIVNTTATVNACAYIIWDEA